MPQVPNPTDVDTLGQQRKTSPAEAVLNWQTQKKVAQNSVFQKIKTNVDNINRHFDQSLISLQNIILEIQTRLIILDQKIKQIMAKQCYNYECSQKEAKMKSLKFQLADLQNQLNKKQQEQQQSLYSHPTPRMFDHYSSAPPITPLPFYSPLHLQQKPQGVTPSLSLPTPSLEWKNPNLFIHP